MRTVYKYPLQEIITEVIVPFGSSVVGVAMQHGVPTVWIELDREANIALGGLHWMFYVVGTGHAIPEGPAHMDHVGLVFDRDYVWHIYKGW